MSSKAGKHRRAKEVEVDSLLADREIEEAVRHSSIRATELQLRTLARGIRYASRTLVSAASPSQVYKELKALHRATIHGTRSTARLRDAEVVADRIANLSEEALLVLRRRRLGFGLPMRDQLTCAEPGIRRENINRVRGLLVCCWSIQDGRRRSGDTAATPKRKKLEVHFGMGRLSSGQPTRAAESDFIMWMRAAYFDAFGKLPLATSKHDPRTDFADLCQLVLEKIRADDFDVVNAINRLQRVTVQARKEAQKRAQYSMSCNN